jgi:hypothetical protein
VEALGFSRTLTDAEEPLAHPRVQWSGGHNPTPLGLGASGVAWIQEVSNHVNTPGWGPQPRGAIFKDTLTKGHFEVMETWSPWKL